MSLSLSINKVFNERLQANVTIHMTYV